MKFRFHAHGWRDQHRTYWSSMADGYNALYRSNWNKLEDAATVDLLRGISWPATARILDLGCGTGLGRQLLCDAAKQPEYHGLDISAAMLSKCSFGSHLHQGRMSDLSRFPTGYFHGVTALYTSLSFTDYFQRTITEIKRVMMRGGFAFLSVLSRFSLRRCLRFRFNKIERFRTRGALKTLGYTPAWTFTRRRLHDRFERAGFSVRRIEGQSVFGGVCEWAPLWPLDKVLSRLFAPLAHTINIIAQSKQI